MQNRELMDYTGEKYIITPMKSSIKRNGGQRQRLQSPFIIHFKKFLNYLSSFPFPLFLTD